MACNIFPLADLPYKCEGSCWQLGGASELVGCMGGFLHFQLPNELESHRLGSQLLNLVQNIQNNELMLHYSIHAWFFFLPFQVHFPSMLDFLLWPFFLWQRSCQKQREKHWKKFKHALILREERGYMQMVLGKVSWNTDVKLTDVSSIFCHENLATKKIKCGVKKCSYRSNCARDFDFPGLWNRGERKLVNFLPS